MASASELGICKYLSPEMAGISLTPREFDSADFEAGFRYELIRGVLVVSPMTSPFERGPNELLGYWLLDYQLRHPQGAALDGTLPENDILVGQQRRRADRVIWAGLGRAPKAEELPTIAVEFVSAGKHNFLRDYEEKRREYASIAIQEYWVINRFSRTLTIYRGSEQVSVFQAHESYFPQLLPGFELRLIALLDSADRWKPA